MIKSKDVVAELRRDMTYVLHVIVAIVLTGFATIVVASALYDLLSWRH